MPMNTGDHANFEKKIAGREVCVWEDQETESGQADVSLFWHRGGHELGSDDVEAAKTWLVDKVIKKPAA